VSRDRPRDVLFRAATAACRGKVLQRDPEELTKDDAAANLILRAAKTPALIGTGGWANQLAATAVDDMLVSLAGPCAAAELRRLGLRVDFGRYATTTVPARVVLATDCGGFVVEGDPIPVKVLTLAAGATLAPTPLAVIVVFSDVLAETSNFERVITQMLSEAVRLKVGCRNVLQHSGVNIAAGRFVEWRGSAYRDRGRFRGHGERHRPACRGIGHSRRRRKSSVHLFASASCNIEIACQPEV
jgi:hypothetical protein